MIKIDGIREWYKERLGWDIPPTEVVELPGDYLLPSFGKLDFFVAPIRTWSELDQAALEKSEAEALDFLMKDSRFRGIDKGILIKRAKEVIAADIADYRTSEEEAKHLREITGDKIQIYTFPRGAQWMNNCPANEEIVAESILAHEILHTEQEKRGLNQRFPHIREGPAWTLQILYGADHVGLGEYLRRAQYHANRVGVPQERSLRERIYTANMEAGIGVVVNELGLDLAGDPNVQLQKLRTVLDMPRYSRMESEVRHQYLKRRLEE